MFQVETGLIIFVEPSQVENNGQKIFNNIAPAFIHFNQMSE